LLLIYKYVNLIETNKNMNTKLRFWYKNEDQRSILTINLRCVSNYNNNNNNIIIIISRSNKNNNNTITT